MLALRARSEPRNVEAGDAQVSAFVPFDPMSTSSGAVTVRSGSLDGDLPVWWPVSLHPGDLLLVAGRVPWRRLANYTGRPRSLELIRWRAVRAESTVLSAVPIDMELRGLA